MKNGMQEVPKGDKWSETPLLPRKLLPAPERHLCLQTILKKAIKPNPLHPPTGPPVSRSPCIPYYAIFLFSSL
jgi:hypothetical protein